MEIKHSQLKIPKKINIFLAPYTPPNEASQLIERYV